MNTRRVIGIYPSENKVLSKLKLLKKDGMKTEHMIIVNPSEPQKNLPAPSNILQKLMTIGVSESEAKLYAEVLKEGQYILLNTVIQKKYLT